MSSIATVEPRLLSLLNPEEAVDIFRDLLWAESWRQGINVLNVNVPSNITAPDGGIDAEVKDVPVTEGLLSQGLTEYQLKTGDFPAHQDAKIKELLCKKDSFDLKERVASCLRNSGTFVIVLFGSDSPNTTEDDATVTKCVELLKKHHAGIVDPKIKVIRANQIAGMLSRHIALSLRAQRIGTAAFRTHQQWAGQSEMRLAIQYGPTQEELRSLIEKELRDRTHAVHVCLTGEPGAGKTRMVLEATRARDLAPLVVYCASIQQSRQSGIVDLIIHEPQRHAIVVVDDIEPQDAQSLWNEFEHQGARIKLITLQHEVPRMGGSTMILSVPLLSDKQVLEILQQYVPGTQSQGFVPLCSGSPRVAHVIGGNLRLYPHDLLKSPDTVDVWGRFIGGNDNPASDIVRERHTLLRYCALFKKFGFRKPVEAEVQAIMKLVQKDHAEITNGKILDAITSLQGRRILQGDATLYITPKALHIKLWGEWWDQYGSHIEFESFVDALPPSLRRWFYDMFRYAKESGVATKLVENLLGPDGPFVKTSLLSSASGVEVFNVLAEANPEGGLDCLEATIGKESLEDLRKNTTARRHIVWALERIAMWQPLFGRAAILLARLAVAENEPGIANNATGVFCDLFSLAPGELATTEAHPLERLPILETMLSDPEPLVRALALQACNTALNYGHFSRTIGAEVQGLRIPPRLWTPKTYLEWFSLYEQIWNLTRESLRSLQADEQEQGRKILIQHANRLGRIPHLSRLVVTTMEEIAASGEAKRELVEEVEHIVQHLEEFPPEDRPLWNAVLEQAHGGTSFAARFHRHVGRAAFGDDESLAIASLAQEALQDSTLLAPLLPWLFSNEALSAHLFGYHLATADSEAAYWTGLLKQASTLSDPNVSVLGGYLRATKERSEDLWYAQLLECSAADTIAPTLYLLIFQSGLNDRAGKLLTQVLRQKRGLILGLRQFTIGTEIRKLTEETFAEWRALLRTGAAQETQALLELMAAFYVRIKPNRPVPLPETVQVLTDERLFEEGTESYGMLTDHFWGELANAAVTQDSTHVSALATVVLDHIGIESALMHQFGDTGPTTWLRGVAQQDPLLIWHLIKDRLGPPIDRRAFHLKAWIDGSHAFDQRQPNFLDSVPHEELWAWADADIEHRAWYLAHLVAPILRPESLARAVLIRYGQREDVQSNLCANFDTEGYMGHESTHQDGKRRAMEALLGEETNQNVRHWITKYIAYLKQRIERARIEEEREF